MTDKRYYTHTSLIKEDKVHDKICHRFMNLSETVEHMNMYYQKYTALKKENEQLRTALKELKEIGDYQSKRINELSDENEQLEKELDCFKPLIFETDGMPITLYEKKDDGDVE